MRILYVEDNETNQALVGRVVRAKKHDVIFKDEGEGALDVLAADTTIDLVLLDIELAGGISGIDVVKTLRTRGDKRPVVAVTAYAMMGDRERILDAGCDQYLPKPLVIVDLMALMDHYEAEVAEKRAAPVATPAAAPVEQAVDAAVTPAVVPPAVAPATTPADTPVPVLQSEPAPVAESVPASQPDPAGIMPAPQPAANTAAPVPVPVPVPTPATAPAPADTPQATIEPTPAVEPGPAVEVAMPTVVVSVPNSGDNAQ